MTSAFADSSPVRALACAALAVTLFATLLAGAASAQTREDSPFSTPDLRTTQADESGQLRRAPVRPGPVLAGPTPTPTPTSPTNDQASVAVAMGDSFISGQGAGDYERTGSPWWGSVEDVNYCDRSRVASIHVAEMPDIDRRYNVACSGASLADIVAPSGARGGVPSQIDQLVEIASNRDERVDVIQFAIGVNNDAFYFGSIIEACVSGFINDGYTHSGFWLARTDGRWYEWAFDGWLGGGNTEGLHRQCDATGMPFYTLAPQRYSVAELVDAIDDFVAAVGDPAGGRLTAYSAQLRSSWFTPANAKVPMMALPLPADLINSLTAWEDAGGIAATRSGSPHELRLLRLLHLWQGLYLRETWGPAEWTGSETPEELLDFFAELQVVPPAQVFPPSIGGQAISREVYDQLSHVVSGALPSSMVEERQGPAIGEALVLLTNRMGQITENGQQKYPPGSYRIVVQDYASPFDPQLTMQPGNDSANRFISLVRSRYSAGCPLHQSSAQWADGMADVFSTTIDSAVNHLHANAPGHDVVRLDVRDALDGGRLCESANASLVAPIRFGDWTGSGPDFVDDIDSRTSLGLGLSGTLKDKCEYWEVHVCQDGAHPNASGHNVLGRCLAAARQATVDRVDCDRVNGSMLVNGSPLVIVDNRPQVTWEVADSSYSIVTEQLPGFPEPSCDYVEWEITVVASVDDPLATGVYANATWSFDLDNVSGVVVPGGQIVSGSMLTVRAQASCAPFVEVGLEFTATATAGTNSVSASGLALTLIGDTGGPV